MLVQTENNRSFYAVCATSFLLRVEWGVATGFLPVHVSELGGSPVDVALVFSVFAAIMVPTSLLWGVISDVIGKRNSLIVIGMVGLLPIYFLIAFQEDIHTLILLRGTTAILKGAVAPCSWALVSDLSSRESMGRNMGILSASELAGFAVGPAFGGVIADLYGFKALWFSVAAICLIGGLISLVAGKDSARLVRSTATIPLLDTIRKRGSVSRILVVSMALAFVLLGYSFLGPNLNVYLINGLGYSKSAVGLFSFIGMGLTSITQPFLGHFSDRYGRKPIMILGALSPALGNLVLLIGGQIHLVVIAEILINYYGTFNTVASAYVSDVVNSRERSGALGILNSMGSFARSAASVAGGWVILISDVPTALKISILFPVVAVLLVVALLKNPEPHNE
jgi:DHA1 family multidrug resistance protein-like MFS transporter